ncbi:MAG: hypothetical protein JNK34_02835 [Tabrizicola sp.]|nr:hypothetical protein [Tabrizicola sp.]
MDQTTHLRTRDIIQRITDLAPLVAQHQPDFDLQRRLSQPVVDAMVAADLFRLWIPRDSGGQEISPQALVEVVEAASAIDASFGWCLTNAAAAAQFMAYLPVAVTRPWFISPDCQMSGSTAALGNARRTTGGFIISGRWPFVSGIMSAHRVYLLCQIDGEGEPGKPVLLYGHVARSDVDVLDTWHTTGLRGSGSHDIVVTDRFVPDDHCHGLDGARPVQGGSLYRFPIPTLLTLSVGIVPLGIAKAAIAAFTDLSEKTRAGTNTPFRDRELIQDNVGRADAIRRAARALVFSSLDALEEAFDQGGRPLIEARATFRLAMAHSAESCLKVVEMMVACAGAAAIFESSPLARLLRDAQAATKHVAVAPHLFALGGRIAMGMEPGLARF